MFQQLEWVVQHLMVMLIAGYSKLLFLLLLLPAELSLVWTLQKLDISRMSSPFLFSKAPGVPCLITMARTL